MPGHSYPRNMYTSGHDIMGVLKRQVRKRPITLVEDAIVTDLIQHRGQVCGAVGLDLRRGEQFEIAARAVVLATGGSHNVYGYTTGPEDLTGDGQAMALRAGARLVNMEMTQFLPTTLMEPPIARGSLFPFLLGPQNALRLWLLNRYGERFMARWDSQRMEHSTRDLVSIGIMTEVFEGRGSPLGGAYYSLAHLPKNLVRDFARWGAKPFIDQNWSAHGLNFKHLVDRLLDGEAIEVAPAAHFFMGGVLVDQRFETGLPGLFAAGEVTGPCHGANRLSGNATTQVVVQGARAGAAAAEYVQRQKGKPPRPKVTAAMNERLEAPLRRESGPNAYEVRQELQRISAEQVGVVRDGERLASAVERLQQIRRDVVPTLASRERSRVYNREWLECLQVESMAVTLETIARAALFRQESRGAHYRRDFPKPDYERWQLNTVITARDGDLEIVTSPVRATTLQPPGDGEAE
jgi:succinate dehydrogenase/fumarate reductase flavoprotein subunit